MENLPVRALRARNFPDAILSIVRSLRRYSLPTLAIAALLAPVSFAQSSSAEDPVVGPKNGSLVLIGGGFPPAQIMRRFVDLAGGSRANFVVMPTAQEGRAAADEVRVLLTAGVNPKNITILNTHDRAIADSEQFVAPLRRANAVWLNGGNQWRLADVYLGTRTVAELFGVLDRGGVIGGNSAGASIQASFLVRGAPQDNRIIMWPPYMKGFGFLRGVAVDQHLLTRERQNGLLYVIDAFPEILGIGLDEQTAIVVHGDRFEVIGLSKVAIYDKGYIPPPKGKRYYFLRPGDRFDMRTRSIEPR